MCVAAVLVADIVRPVIFRAQDGDRTETVREALASGVARNTLLFIGDGMGDSEITAARNYAVGAPGRLAMDPLPLTGHYTTYAGQEIVPTLPDYVTDSAASGTTWAMGHRRATTGLLIVTADHGHTSQIVSIPTDSDHPAGLVSVLLTHDQAPMAIAYITNAYHRSMDHTGTQVRAMPWEVPSR